MTSLARHLIGVVGAVIPDDDLTGAVLTLGNGPLELPVVERVILDVDREVIGLGVHRQALGQRPRHEHAVAFESKVPVQRSGVVLLDDERREWSTSSWRPPSRAHGFGSLLRISSSPGRLVSLAGGVARGPSARAMELVRLISSWRSWLHSPRERVRLWSSSHVHVDLESLRALEEVGLGHRVEPLAVHGAPRP
jgi:hypothetical protein